MRILFLHGLDGTIHGTKARYLRQRFGEEHVIIPEWNVSNQVADCVEAIVDAAKSLPDDDD